MTYILLPGSIYRIAIPQRTEVFTVGRVEPIETIMDFGIDYIEVDTRRWNRAVIWDGHRVTIYEPTNRAEWEIMSVAVREGNIEPLRDFHATSTFEFYYDSVAANNTPPIYISESSSSAITYCFAPLAEMDDADPNFVNYLIRLGESDDFLREQQFHHDRLMQHLGRPLEEREYTLLDAHLERLREREERQRAAEQRRLELNVARWGTEKPALITPEREGELEEKSLEFLAEFINEAQMAIWKRYGYIRVISPSDPGRHYIIQRPKNTRVFLYVNGQPMDALGYHAKYEEFIHPNDTAAMKVFDILYNEEEVKKISCHQFIKPKQQKAMNDIYGYPIVLKENKEHSNFIVTDINGDFITVTADSSITIGPVVANDTGQILNLYRDEDDAT